jgi:hypothetical protein
MDEDYQSNYLHIYITETAFIFTYLAFNLVYYLNMSLIDQSYYLTAPQGVRLNGVSLVK